MLEQCASGDALLVHNRVSANYPRQQLLVRPACTHCARSRAAARTECFDKRPNTNHFLMPLQLGCTTRAASKGWNEGIQLVDCMNMGTPTNGTKRQRCKVKKAGRQSPQEAGLQGPEKAGLQGMEAADR